MESQLLREVEYLKYAVQQGEKQYQISKDSIELINVKCHDIKYKLDALSAQGESARRRIKGIARQYIILRFEKRYGQQPS